LILILSVVGNLTDRRVGRGRDFHEIQAALAGQFHGLEGLHDAELPANFVYHPDLAGPDALVDARAVRLPEITFCDKSP